MLDHSRPYLTHYRQFVIYDAYWILWASWTIIDCDWPSGSPTIIIHHCPLSVAITNPYQPVSTIDQYWPWLSSISTWSIIKQHHWVPPMMVDALKSGASLLFSCWRCRRSDRSSSNGRLCSCVRGSVSMARVAWLTDITCGYPLVNSPGSPTSLLFW